MPGGNPPRGEAPLRGGHPLHGENPLHGEDLLAAARERGADLVTGVPCSFLTPVINAAIDSTRTRYVGATSEGEAVGIAAGAWLGGGSPVVMGQNSGLGNMVNPLTSLVRPARIPLLMLCTWRGRPGFPDEPQHEQMGRIMTGLLDTLEIEWAVLEADLGTLGDRLDRAYDVMAARAQPYCLILRKGVVADQELREAVPVRPPRGQLRGPAGGTPVVGTRARVLEELLARLPEEAVVIATTGRTGRELFTLADRPQHFYLVGAMGCASAVGLGVALRVPQRPVVVVDGDGAALMKLGNLATVGTQAPARLVHILLDNGVHDSTGGQRTNAAAVDFPALAVACGYRTATTCASTADLGPALADALAAPGPHLLYVRTAPGTLPSLGRPTVTPAEVARRFRDHLTRPLAGTSGRASAGAVPSGAPYGR